MKKMLLSAALLMAAFSANAQIEIGYLDPATANITEDGVEIAAGTTLATTEHVTVTNLYAAGAYKATGLKGNNMSVNGTPLETSGMGVQGSVNGPGTAASAGEFPTSGTVYRFVPTADGYLYLFHAGSGNKNYVVFEEMASIGYTYAMENTGGDDYNAGLCPDKFSYDLTTVDGACTYDAELDQYFVNEGFAILQAGQVAEGNDAAYTYNHTSGNSVIKFKVFANCRYDVLATGSKMTLAAFAFDTTGDATVTTENYTLLENGQIPGVGAGITEVVADEAANADAPAYNIAGQRVNKDAKGIVIINGKKYLNK